MHKKIILCADDFAQNEAISHGILNLVEQKKLKAVSCFTDGKLWQPFGHELLQYKQRVDMGLHFNLTHRFIDIDANHGLGYWVIRSITAELPVHAIREKLHRQISEFRCVTGQNPVFIDGHQHVHVFPGIRRVILEYLLENQLNHDIYLRSVTPLIPPAALMKSLLIKSLAQNWEEEVGRYCKTNTSFAGVYSLKARANYSFLFRKWIKRGASGSLIMCHPGLPGHDSKDSISTARAAEYNFFQSSQFMDICQTENVIISRFRDYASVPCNLSAGKPDTLQW